MTEHIMIDIETLGTRHNAVILSVGAVKFDSQKIYKDDGFYSNLNWQLQLDNGGTVTEDTIRFWMKQPSTIRETVFNKKGVPPAEMVAKFNSWFSSQVKDPKKCCVWAAGPQFDLSLLKDLYRRFFFKELWSFWAERCVRTAGMVPHVKETKRPRGMTEHHAFHDAVYQAMQVRKFLIACGGSKKLAEDNLLS